MSEPTEKLLTITESSANKLLAALSDLPWKHANPLIVFVQNELKPIDAAEGETELETKQD